MTAPSHKAALGGRKPGPHCQSLGYTSTAMPLGHRAHCIIGGDEEKHGRAVILRAIAERAQGGSLVVVTLASQQPKEIWQEYQQAFIRLGVKRITHLDVSKREYLLQNSYPEVLKGASVLFFTGGGQLQITSHFGGTQLCQEVQEFYRRGGIIAGTSAGASVMSDTMLVNGNSESSHRIGDSLGWHQDLAT